MQLLGPYAEKYRTGTILNQFKGILNELETEKRAFIADGNGRVFHDERKIRLLRRYQQRIDRLEHLMRGDRRVGGSYFPGERPPPEAIAEYRQRLEDLARTALRNIRD